MALIQVDRLFNYRCQPVDLWLSTIFGASTKRDDPDSIGEHGDGLKMVSLLTQKSRVKIDPERH